MINYGVRWTLDMNKMLLLQINQFQRQIQDAENGSKVETSLPWGDIARAVNDGIKGVANGSDITVTGDQCLIQFITMDLSHVNNDQVDNDAKSEWEKEGLAVCHSPVNRDIIGYCVQAYGYDYTHNQVKNAVNKAIARRNELLLNQLRDKHSTMSTPIHTSIYTDIQSHVLLTLESMYQAHLMNKEDVINTSKNNGTSVDKSVLMERLHNMMHDYHMIRMKVMEEKVIYVGCLYASV